VGRSPGNEVASTTGTRFLQTPDGYLILSFGLQAFEIAASLVGDVVEEN